MIFKDQELLTEAYDLVSEKKAKNKKLSPAQKKIARMAPPPDEITGKDFKSLKNVKETTTTFRVLFNQIISNKKN